MGGGELEVLVERAGGEGSAGAEELGFEGEPEFVDEVGFEECGVDFAATEKGAVLAAAGLELGNDFRRGGVGELDAVGLGVGGVSVWVSGDNFPEVAGAGGGLELVAKGVVGATAEDHGIEGGQDLLEEGAVGVAAEVGARLVVASDESVEGGGGDEDEAHLNSVPSELG